MIEVLEDELGDANIIVLAMDGNLPRFDAALYAMLRQMSSIFGETWYVNVIDFHTIFLLYIFNVIHILIDCVQVGLHDDWCHKVAL